MAMIHAQFDPTQRAVINPWDIVQPIPGMPQVAVTCFARDTFHRLLDGLGGLPIAQSNVANMTIPVYRTEYFGKQFALYMSDVGAPACAGLLEDVYAMGVQKVVVFGTCGVLDREIGDCSVIIPNRAVRDEGTSYHYLPASDEMEVNPRYIDTFVEILERHGCHYTLGKVWTTDAIYRETRERVAAMKRRGCVCVDMECSALAAVAQFRGKELFQFFYAADNLDGEEWDVRSLSNESKPLEKDRIAALTMELAAAITGAEGEAK